MAEESVLTFLREDPIKDISFYIGDAEKETIARYREIQEVPIPDEGDIVGISEAEGVPVDDADSDFEFEEEPRGQYLVKDIKYHYSWLEYPNEGDEAEYAERLYCNVYIEVEEIPVPDEQET